MVLLTWEDIIKRIEGILSYADALKIIWEDSSGAVFYGVPRGGAIVVGVMKGMRPNLRITNDPSAADYIIDDLLDSGRTMSQYAAYSAEFKVLINKQTEYPGQWIQFPWEDSGDKDIEDSVARVIEFIGEDVARDGLQETPARVVRSWDELYGGYKIDAGSLLKWFEDDTDEMVVVKDIDFFSTCEHHMLPFFGRVHIAYVPKGWILGVSKLSRVVDAFARRLQVQERLTRQIGEVIEAHTNGVAVVVQGQHLCMAARGVKQAHSTMNTNYLTGLFRTAPALRQEFLASIRA